MGLAGAGVQFAAILAANGGAPLGQMGHTRPRLYTRSVESCMQTSGLAGQTAQIAPRSTGRSEPETQSVRQSARLSSARANNSASLASLPAAIRLRRLSMQAIAAPRAGSVSPWQTKPEMRTAG